jgi:hypothetical protein
MSVSMSDDYEFWVDTVGSTEGQFSPDDRDILVQLNGPYGWVIVRVSARYTAPERDEAVTLAAREYLETGCRDVPWLSMGYPGFWAMVRGVNRSENDPLYDWITCRAQSDEDGDWTITAESSEKGSPV